MAAGDIQTDSTVYCANPDHSRPTKAVAKLTFPDGHFKPTTACKGDLQWMVRDAIDEQRPIHIEPVKES